ncbi:tripartite tricarboxylate transporter substrate binding protein [Sabulicella rubraurantiaca]|uniref:tripartite tricarboxylate transporter substrate binding protein n=1 Tax=Sabulicella rubraurantiaca TaxID=2811429 RepID=UPI001A95696C|nr:tripartite tricarboxylate transporter substrate binding protein [Sabulicella rubraurantiaca]
MIRQLPSRRQLVLGALGAPLATAALAQPAYPNRPVRIVVPYAPGGGADILARAIGERLSEVWRQPVVVENRPGAGGSVGTETVARAQADGYTMLMASPSHSINPALYKNLPFDTLQAFTPITIVASGPLVLVTNASAPFTGLRQLVDHAKANPARVAYASAGIGSSPHFAGELLSSLAGLQMTHVPYRGTGPALVDLMANRVQMFFGPVPTILEHVRDGRLKALAVTTKTRFAALANVPSVAERGYPDYELLQWWGLMVPAGTPAEVAGEQYTQVKRILESPAMRERLAGLGAEPGGGAPAEFDALIRDEIQRWTRLVQTANLTPE